MEEFQIVYIKKMKIYGINKMLNKKFFPELVDQVLSKELLKGELLKKLRTDKGYLLNELAEMCKISSAHICSIESGNKKCGRELSITLGIIFDVDPEKFL